MNFLVVLEKPRNFFTQKIKTNRKIIVSANHDNFHEYLPSLYDPHVNKEKNFGSLSREKKNCSILDSRKCNYPYKYKFSHTMNNI